MISWVAAAGLALTMSRADPATGPSPAEQLAYADEAAAMATRWRAEDRCRTMLRPEGESVEACTERRLGLLRTPDGGFDYSGVSRIVAGDARKRCEDGELLAGEPIGACMERVMAAIDAEAQDDIFGGANDLAGAFEITPRAAPPPRPPEPRAGCRREYTRSEDGSSSSSTVICGNGDHEATRQVLDSLLRPNR